ncbi:MAG: glycosyl hydrolase family 28-related protein [Opitutaceae bacterium]
MANHDRRRASPEAQSKYTAMATACAALAALAILAGAAGSEPAAHPGEPALAGASVNVRNPPYLAAGDGKTDDTRAIQAALDAVGAGGGGTVLVPAGTYLVGTHLVVPAGTSLAGVGRAPELYADKAPGSTLLAVEGAGHADGPAFITLQGPNSVLQGLKVLYPGQVVADRPVAFPWTVRGGAGDGAALIDVLLVNPYQAVDLATQGGSRHYIRGLYGQPLLKGIWVDRCTDIGRIHDVHFWPFWSQDKRILDFTEANATSFIFQRADWEVVENIFSWGYHVGIELSASKDGSTNGQMTDVDLDGVDIGIDARSTQQPGVSISNLAIANDARGTSRVAIWGRAGADAGFQERELNGRHVREPNTVVLFVRGGSFWGQLDRVVRWENPGLISLSDSRLVPWMLNGPMIELLAGQAMIHDNSMTIYPGVVKGAGPGTAVAIGPGVAGAIIHHNQLNGNRVDNGAGPLADVSGNMP